MHQWQLRRIAMSVVLLGALALAVGCEAAGFIAGALSSNKTPAIYEPKDLTTVILVDDPALQLHEPGLAGTIAMTIAANLKQQGVLSNIIDIQKVSELAAELGSDYARTPVDQIGRKLGATQVIHVHIDSIPPFQTEPGLLKPRAAVLVKVIDVEHRIRLFPPAQPLEGQGVVPVARGAYPMTIEARLRVVDPNVDNAMAAYRHRFAEKMGLEIARVFYEHDPAKDLRED